MIGLDNAHHTRLITAIRTLAELLDNCADGLVSGVIAATVLLLVIIALHAMADLLETCPEALALLIRPIRKGADLP
ncbi:hypothetical protein E1267_39840 [Nonomuraea longispora]|uniref:Uncharacterized protein n=1 Tax=Nonomuraea longispora TaxID=1848320 RepID=A0A4R4MQS1_9ACTN|nr:hypothetical protein [Nonomuraea longispora]TDB97423.1 hypothetical protein E1267_39840 [Nonomuraea longispora]